MTLNESDVIPDINSDDLDIRLKPTYPSVSSLIRLFFVLLFYMIIVAIPALMLRHALNTFNVKSPLLDSFLNLLIYIITMLATVRYVITKKNIKDLLASYRF